MSAPTVFIPGAGRTWTPQVDVSKPVSSVRLRVSCHGHLARTLTGTGPDGSIRDLHWNGRTTAGQRVSSGPCAWTLFATDGDGTLMDVDGHTSVHGTLRVR